MAGPAQDFSRGPDTHEIQQRADRAEREERVADEEQADMDEDPVALQGRNERVNLRYVVEFVKWK